ncbi:MAG: sugar phosphate isomerase/epimerase family protein [bacterium]
MKYSVFTVMMPEFDPRETVQNLKEAGYDGVEWRVQTIPTNVLPGTPTSYWGYNKSTIDLATILEKAEEIKSFTEEAGLEIPALAPYLQPNQFSEIKRVMEAAKIMGCPQIRVGVPRYDRSGNYNEIFDSMLKYAEKIEDLARETGVKANFEIHHGTITPSAGLAHRLVSHFDPQYIGVIYDPGNMIHEGRENWRMGMELLGPYLAHVHVKSAAWRILRGEPDGTLVWEATWSPLKYGVANWREIVSDLKAVGYNGYLSFEDFSSEEDTLRKIRSDIAYLKSLERA